ncbi:MAG: hypothetical protein IOB84_13665 [Brevundimonas sp.]|nr:hypothetical protein [Brevundimonas sp.]
MAVAMTLGEYAKTLPADSVDRAYVELYAQSSDLIAAMPWETVSGGLYRYSQENTLPGIAFRGINENYTPTTGVINPQVEQTFIAGGEIKVDIALVRRHGESKRAQQEKMQVKALTRGITSAILAGNNATNPKQFDGLRRRLTGSAVRTNSAASGGAALSLYNLDRAIDTCTEPTHLLMPKALRTRLTQAGRNTGVGGYVDQTKDDFGNLITSYRQLPILVGYENEADGALLPFDEVATGGGSAVTASIYVLSIKTGMFSGFQAAPLSAKDLGEMQGEPKWLTRTEWDCGIRLEHPFAAIRVPSITDAAITA